MKFKMILIFLLSSLLHKNNIHANEDVSSLSVPHFVAVKLKDSDGRVISQGELDLGFYLKTLNNNSILNIENLNEIKGDFYHENEAIDLSSFDSSDINFIVIELSDMPKNRYNL